MTENKKEEGILRIYLQKGSSSEGVCADCNEWVNLTWGHECKKEAK